MPIDVTLPGGLTLALAPDLILLAGAMVLMLWAAWRPDSVTHQRSVGIGSLVVTVITTAAVIWFAISGATAGPGIIAVDGFRWAADLIFLIATFIGSQVNEIIGLILMLAIYVLAFPILLAAISYIYGRLTSGLTAADFKEDDPDPLMGMANPV